MQSTPQNCERPCLCKEKHITPQFVVLTGGPGAGKTAVLEFVRKALCEHIAILPEAASILFGGGFWRLDSRSGKMAAQRAIYHVQEEMQRLVLEERKWSMGLCDRGTLDGLAYWPEANSEFYDVLNTNLEMEFKKYKAVIHLRSPTLEKGYNYQNPIRVESAELAAKIDENIHEIWKNHSNYFVIESTDDFTAKLQLATKCIQSLIPECCKNNLIEIGR
ncbi:hypothetical protein CIK05_10890 [Bdellovibrio sp. qaytius]|nr:hypothetical protein CIK05_10890 [Bdellovibrio sp. qaytius]